MGPPSARLAISSSTSQVQRAASVPPCVGMPKSSRMRRSDFMQASRNRCHHADADRTPVARLLYHILENGTRNLSALAAWPLDRTSTGGQHGRLLASCWAHRDETIRDSAPHSVDSRPIGGKRALPLAAWRHALPWWSVARGESDARSRSNLGGYRGEGMALLKALEERGYPIEAIVPWKRRPTITAAARRSSIRRGQRCTSVLCGPRCCAL
jgi:hypothetical protein